MNKNKKRRKPLTEKIFINPKIMTYSYKISARNIFLFIAEQEFDRAFEFIVHELRRMEVYNDCNTAGITTAGYQQDYFEEFTIRYLEKVEGGMI